MSIAMKVFFEMKHISYGQAAAFGCLPLFLLAYAGRYATKLKQNPLNINEIGLLFVSVAVLSSCTFAYFTRATLGQAFLLTVPSLIS